MMEKARPRVEHAGQGGCCGVLERIQSEFLRLVPEGLGLEEELTCTVDVFADDARFFVFHVDAEVMGGEVKNR